MRRLRYWLPRLTLAAVSVPLTFYALESFSLRMLHAPFVIYPSIHNCLQRTQQLSTEFRPNCTGFWAETHFHTNEIGLRGEPVRDDGSRRILSIGDSCTWGWQVADDQSYPAQLNRLLNERARAKRYQVFNAGVPGYTSLQGWRYLTDAARTLHPALVVAGYGFNDATRDGDVAALIERQARLMPLLLIDDFFTEHSHFYRWLRWEGRAHEKATAFSPNAPRVDPVAFEHNLAQIVETARAGGAPVIFLNFVERTAPAYTRALSNVAGRMDVPVITYDGPRLDMVHPTADGYHGLATAIARHIDD